MVSMNPRRIVASREACTQVNKGTIELALFVWFIWRAAKRGETIRLIPRMIGNDHPMVWLLHEIVNTPPKDWRTPIEFNESDPNFKKRLGHIALMVIVENEVSIMEIDRCLAEVGKQYPATQETLLSIATEYADLYVKHVTSRESALPRSTTVVPSKLLPRHVVRTSNRNN